eukprot:15250991-Alexandrium_andersonii.AAC.1
MGGNPLQGPASSCSPIDAGRDRGASLPIAQAIPTGNVPDDADGIADDPRTAVRALGVPKKLRRQSRSCPFGGKRGGAGGKAA